MEDIPRRFDDSHQATSPLERLAALGELVWPGGGGGEVLQLVEQVKAGRSFNIDELIRPDDGWLPP